MRAEEALMEYNVLLVDDDTNLLEALERSLHQEPYRIFTAQSGQRAMEILGEHPVDVVVSDQEMPGLKGTQFLWKTRNAYPDVILFMLTGRATRKMARLATDEIGITRIFTKPCNASDLALAIRQALQHRDLLKHTRTLLHIFHIQQAILDKIERRSPGTLRDAEEAFDDKTSLLDPPPDEAGLLQALDRVIASWRPPN